MLRAVQMSILPPYDVSGVLNLYYEVQDRLTNYSKFMADTSVIVKPCGGDYILSCAVYQNLARKSHSLLQG